MWDVYACVCLIIYYIITSGCIGHGLCPYTCIVFTFGSVRLVVVCVIRLLFLQWVYTCRPASVKYTGTDTVIINHLW